MIKNKNNRYKEPMKFAVMTAIAASAILSIIPQANALNVQTKNGAVTSSNSEVLLIAQIGASSQRTRCYDRVFRTRNGRPYTRRVCNTTTTRTTTFGNTTTTRTRTRTNVCRFYPYYRNGKHYIRRVCQS